MTSFDRQTFWHTHCSLNLTSRNRAGILTILRADPAKQERDMGDIFRIKEFGYLQKGMDMLSVRQTATISNIANAETPGYKAAQVSFEDKLASAIGQGFKMTQTNPRHMPLKGKGVYGVTPDVSTVTQGARLDGNTVDMDKELTTLSGTQFGYTALTVAANKKIGSLINALDSQPRR
jgi:flagellar basal-body rod protein FlgB